MNLSIGRGLGTFLSLRAARLVTVTPHTQLASTEFCGHSLEAGKYSLYLGGHVLLKTSPAMEKSFGETMSDHFHNQGQSPGVMVSLVLRKTRSQPHREGGRGSVDRDEFAGKRTSTYGAIGGLENSMVWALQTAP